jgi:hypothetical protein
MRVFVELNTPVPGQPKPAGASIWWTRHVVESVREAMRDGIRPDEPAATHLVSGMFGTADHAEVLRSLEAGIAAGAERYFQLVSRVRGRTGSPDSTEQLHWLATALRHRPRG